VIYPYACLSIPLMQDNKELERKRKEREKKRRKEGKENREEKKKKLKGKDSKEIGDLSTSSIFHIKLKLYNM